MERPSETVPLEDLSVLDKIQPKIPSVLLERESSIWKLSWDHKTSVHRQNKSPDMRCHRASHRGFGCQGSVSLVCSYSPDYRGFPSGKGSRVVSHFQWRST